MVVIGSLQQLSTSAVKRLTPGDLKRWDTEGLAHLTAGSLRTEQDSCTTIHGTLHQCQANRCKRSVR